MTPSARQFLNERKIELIVKEKQGAEHGPEPDSKPMAEGTGRKETEEPAPFKPRFVGPDGGMFAVKPEHLTHLHSNVLVTKRHPLNGSDSKFPGYPNPVKVDSILYYPGGGAGSGFYSIGHRFRPSHRTVPGPGRGRVRATRRGGGRRRGG